MDFRFWRGDQEGPGPRAEGAGAPGGRTLLRRRAQSIRNASDWYGMPAHVSRSDFKKCNDMPSPDARLGMCMACGYAWIIAYRIPRVLCAAL